MSKAVKARNKIALVDAIPLDSPTKVLERNHAEKGVIKNKGPLRRAPAKPENRNIAKIKGSIEKHSLNPLNHSLNPKPWGYIGIVEKKMETTIIKP